MGGGNEKIVGICKAALGTVMAGCGSKETNRQIPTVQRRQIPEVIR